MEDQPISSGSYRVDGNTPAAVTNSPVAPSVRSAAVTGAASGAVSTAVCVTGAALATAGSVVSKSDSTISSVKTFVMGFMMGAPCSLYPTRFAFEPKDKGEKRAALWGSR